LLNFNKISNIRKFFGLDIVISKGFGIININLLNFNKISNIRKFFGLDIVISKGFGIIVGIVVAFIIAVPQVTPIYSSTESGYSVTVSIGKHPFGNEYSYSWIETEDGWRDSVILPILPTARAPQWTFKVPAGYGDSVRVCAASALVAPSNCQTFYAGEDIYVTLDVD
jgi:hypothetical protein